MPEENHSLDRRNKAHQHVIDVVVRDTTPMNADLKRPYVISAKNGNIKKACKGKNISDTRKLH
jgi:hypothetical protein